MVSTVVDTLGFTKDPWFYRNNLVRIQECSNDKRSLPGIRARLICSFIERETHVESALRVPAEHSSCQYPTLDV